MNRIAYATSILYLIFAASCAAADLSSFEFLKTIERADSSHEDILAITLDSDIYAATQRQYADLRIVSQQGDLLPWKLRGVMEDHVKQVRTMSIGKIKSLVENDDNSIEVVIQLPDKTLPVDGIVFSSPLRNFERQVTISGSNDGTNWQSLVENKMLFDYSRYMDVSNNEIALPDNTFRLLKAVIRNVVDQKESPLTELTRQFAGGKETRRTERTMVEKRPLRIDRISLWHTTTRTQYQQHKTTTYPVVTFDCTELPEKKRTVIQVHTRREPLTRFTLETSSVNFSRRVTVQEPIVHGVNTDWTDIGNATLSVFRFRGFAKEHLDVELPERRLEEYRIVIDNGDNTPLAVTGIKAFGNAYEALFLAKANATYSVYYHAESAETPALDTAAIDAVLGKDFHPIAATLGPQTENPTFNARSNLRVKTIMENPFVLGGVIGLMVIVLGLLLVRASRHIAE